MDLMEVKDLVDDGIPEMNFELVIDWLGKNYKNPLKVALPAIRKQGGNKGASLEYDFYDPEEGKPQKQVPRFAPQKVH